MYVCAYFQMHLKIIIAEAQSTFYQQVVNNLLLLLVSSRGECFLPLVVGFVGCFVEFDFLCSHLSQLLLMLMMAVKLLHCCCFPLVYVQLGKWIFIAKIMIIVLYNSVSRMNLCVYKWRKCENRTWHVLRAEAREEIGWFTYV